MATRGKRTNFVPALLMAAAVSGCSNGSPLTTGALFGGNSAAPPPAPPQVRNDPPARAMQVGSTAARALKCGFNIDPAKLRAQYLAYESASNPAPEVIAQATQVYDSAFSGVRKAVAGQGESYCSNRKTAQIKEALSRHLAGDYTPPPPEPAPVEEGLLSSGTSSGSNTEGMERFQKPMRDW